MLLIILSVFRRPVESLLILQLKSTDFLKDRTKRSVPIAVKMQSYDIIIWRPAAIVKFITMSDRKLKIMKPPFCNVKLFLFLQTNANCKNIITLRLPLGRMND